LNNFAPNLKNATHLRYFGNESQNLVPLFDKQAYGNSILKIEEKQVLSVDGNVCLIGVHRLVNNDIRTI